jgi:hypothetical protein
LERKEDRPPFSFYVDDLRLGWSGEQIERFTPMHYGV